MARSLQNNAVTVTTSATLMVDGNPNRTLLTFTNNGSVDVFLGGSSVSSSAYVWPLASGATVQFTSVDGDVAPMAKWYGVTGASSASVSVGEVTR